MFPSLVAGLGNPGREYLDTRHNLGWVVLDALARRHNLAWRSAPQFDAEVARWELDAGRVRWLVKPLTFMNGSGEAIGALSRYYRIKSDRIVAVHDDLAIDLGFVKVSVGGSAGGHNGVASLIEHLGGDFIRFRVGIGPKQPQQMELSDFVLGRFSPEQQSVVQQQLPAYVTGLEMLLEQGAEPAMNQLNRRDPK